MPVLVLEPVPNVSHTEEDLVGQVEPKDLERPEDCLDLPEQVLGELVSDPEQVLSVLVLVLPLVLEAVLSVSHYAFRFESHYELLLHHCLYPFHYPCQDCQFALDFHFCLHHNQFILLHHHQSLSHPLHSQRLFLFLSLSQEDAENPRGDLQDHQEPQELQDSLVVMGIPVRRELQAILPLHLHPLLQDPIARPVLLPLLDAQDPKDEMEHPDPPVHPDAQHQT